MACEYIWFDYQKEDISGDNSNILSCDVLPTYYTRVVPICNDDNVPVSEIKFRILK